MKLIVKGAEEDEIQIIIGGIVASEAEYLKNKREMIKSLLTVSKENQEQMLCKALILLMKKFKTGENYTEEMMVISGLSYVFTDICFGHNGKRIDMDLEWTKDISWDTLDMDANVTSNCFCCRERFPIEKLSSCAVCKQACYCSKECQKKDWKSHKKLCSKC
jgi:hypothetical protein